MKLIISIEELKRESEYNDRKGMTEFYISLNGNLRSSKRVVYYPDTNTFDVHNEIDDSYQEDLTEEQLINETHIVLAIEQGAFYKYEF
ncbi:MAG TPA: hypothetical protein VFX58_17845 [Chitinophagaceae bacterium]|nr:hypothetical protein [Chitinophagaceae bacterium]